MKVVDGLLTVVDTEEDGVDAVAEVVEKVRLKDSVVELEPVLLDDGVVDTVTLVAEVVG